jgi:hypothetical protein
MTQRITPNRVYKYRAFDARSLEMIVEDYLFFADPSTFNDPLDSKPSFENDLTLEDLEELLSLLVQRRIKEQMQRAAKSINPNVSIMPAYISLIVHNRTQTFLKELRYQGSQPGITHESVLEISTHSELLSGYERGIVSFSTRPNCPLLWSHYGDQHKGICVGYSAPNNVPLKPVEYGGERSVKASLVLKMMKGDEKAKESVDQAVLLKKANSWRYEKEWRLLGPHGVNHSTLELEEVIFGLRCPLSVIFAVAKALEGRERKVKLYVIRAKPGTFMLEKRTFNVEDMMAGLPNRAVSLFDDATK